MNVDVIMLGLGLALLIVVNIVLGSVGALFDHGFDWVTFWRGVAKGIVVALCFCAVYLVGWLNPTVVAVTINETAVNLLTAVYMILMAGFLYYAKEVCIKLVAFVKGKAAVEASTK